MENGHDEIEDDIFEHHMHEIDERETPRWEMSEEEPEEDEGRILNCNGLPKQQQNLNKTPAEIIQNGPTWDDVSEQDSVKDYTGPYREQEAKYTERTDEAIFNRAAEEHIRQPTPYDDVDSVKNFGGASQGISRIPSEEHLCLSPPWPLGYEVDDGILLEDIKVAEAVSNEGNSYRVDDMISQAKLQADARISAATWQQEDSMDFTRNYAEEGSLENSRRPSSEDISLTPPWLDTDKESSCKDVEEQVLDDSELPSEDPPTTSSILTSTPTTTHAQLPKTNPHPSVTKPPLTEPSQSPRVAKRSATILSDPTSVPGNISEILPPQRHTPQGQNPDRNNVCTNPVLRQPQMKSYGEVYTNRYPSPHKPYKTNDPYYDPSNMGTVPYPVNLPYGNSLPNPRMSYPAPSSGAEYLQQSNIKSYNRMPAFTPRQYRPRPQGIPNRSQINLTNPSYSNIPHPYPNPGYFSQPHAPRTTPPRQAINRYGSPYYGSHAGDWQYQVRPPQMPTQAPPINTADFAADEVINFAEEKRVFPPDRPRGVPASDIHRNMPAPEHQRGIPEVHRNVSEVSRNVPEFHRGVPDFHRDVSEFRRDLTAANNRRAIPVQRAVEEFPVNILNRGIYSDFPDDVTTVSDSDVSPVMSTRSGSQSSLAVQFCNTPHLDSTETESVMSFTSGASTHQDLDAKIDQVRNILAVIDTRDAKETAQFLYSLSTSKENCQAMRLSGCLPLLIQLQHKSKPRDPRVAQEVRARSTHAIRNIIAAGSEDKRGKRELRVLRLIEVVRSYCTEIRYVRNGISSSKLSALNNALAAITKLSFEEEHRIAIGDLGGVEAIGEFLELSYVNNNGDLSTNVRKCASMTLTNMTFEKTRSKALLGNSPGIVKALLKNLEVLDDEGLIEVSASVLRNLSCKSDERSKMVLQECNAVSELMSAAQKVSVESTLRTILFAIWNLSAHSTENKVKICDTHKALGFLVQKLAYKSPSNSLKVVESSGGILRNLSSQIAVKPEYRATLREHECFKFVLANLRSPSLRVVGNACGILWNLSARCETDQELLIKMGALPLLKHLLTSKNKSISKGAVAAVKNLQNYKTANPGCDSPSETRKQNGILRKENGSPSTPRTKGKSRDAHSLNSFTGSADDMTKENTKQTSRSKENGESDSNNRSKGVRWSDDKRGKDPQRKTSNDRKRGDSSPDEQTAQTSRDLETKDSVNDVTSSVAQLRIGEKSRSKKSEGSFSSPRTKKKSKSKKHHSGGDDVIDENSRLSQEFELNRLTSSRQSSASGRRLASSADVQHVEASAKHPGKVTKGKDGRKGTSGGREDDPDVARSADESPRNSPMSGRHNVRTTRINSDENDFNEDKVTSDLGRCQCAEDSEVWIKRNKICSHCQKRRVSHSSDSTSGSRRSSYESLSSSNRQLNRKEPQTNGTGYVTTL